MKAYLRAADDELAGRVDVVDRTLVNILCRYNGLDNQVSELLSNLLLCDVRRVLRRNDDRVDSKRNYSSVIVLVLHSNLRRLENCSIKLA